MRSKDDRSRRAYSRRLRVRVKHVGPQMVEEGRVRTRAIDDRQGVPALCRLLQRRLVRRCGRDQRQRIVEPSGGEARPSCPGPGSVDVGLAVPAGVQALGPGEPCASGCQRGPMSERRRDDGRCPNVPVWLQVSQEIFLADLAVVDRAP